MGCYFELFCRIKQTEPLLLTSPLCIRQCVHEVRLFVAAMIRLDCPEAYLANERVLKRGKRVKIGFSNELARVINRDKSNLSKMISDIPVMEAVYEDFRNEVEDLILKLKSYAI